MRCPGCAPELYSILDCCTAAFYCVLCTSGWCINGTGQLSQHWKSVSLEESPGILGYPPAFSFSEFLSFPCFLPRTRKSVAAIVRVTYPRDVDYSLYSGGFFIYIATRAWPQRCGLDPGGGRPSSAEPRPCGWSSIPTLIHHHVVFGKPTQSSSPPSPSSPRGGKHQ